MNLIIFNCASESNERSRNWRNFKAHRTCQTCVSKLIIWWNWDPDKTFSSIYLWVCLRGRTSCMRKELGQPPKHSGTRAARLRPLSQLYLLVMKKINHVYPISNDCVPSNTELLNPSIPKDKIKNIDFRNITPVAKRCWHIRTLDIKCIAYRLLDNYVNASIPKDQLNNIFV